MRPLISLLSRSSGLVTGMKVSASPVTLRSPPVWWVGRAYGATVRNRGLRGTRMGRPFLLGGLRARVSSWPPLRLARLRCERVSVGVVSPSGSPSVDRSEGDGDGEAWHAISGWMCIASSRSSRSGGRPGPRRGPDRDTPEALRAWADELRADDQVALEATGNSDAIANLLKPMWAGGGVEPVEDPGDRGGEGQDRQGRRPDPGAAAGGGLPAAGVAAGRRTRGAASAGAPAARTSCGSGPGSRTRSMRSWPATWCRRRRCRICSAAQAGTGCRAARCRPMNAPACRRCCGSWTSTASELRWWTRSSAVEALADPSGGPVDDHPRRGRHRRHGDRGRGRRLPPLPRARPAGRLCRAEPEGAPVRELRAGARSDQQGRPGPGARHAGRGGLVGEPRHPGRCGRSTSASRPAAASRTRSSRPPADRAASRSRDAVRQSRVRQPSLAGCVSAPRVGAEARCTSGAESRRHSHVAGKWLSAPPLSTSHGLSTDCDLGLPGRSHQG